MAHQLIRYAYVKKVKKLFLTLKLTRFFSFTANIV